MKMVDSVPDFKARKIQEDIQNVESKEPEASPCGAPRRALHLLPHLSYYQLNSQLLDAKNKSHTLLNA